jgi:hypothetical protein
MMNDTAIQTNADIPVVDPVTGSSAQPNQPKNAQQNNLKRFDMQAVEAFKEGFGEGFAPARQVIANMQHDLASKVNPNAELPMFEDGTEDNSASFPGARFMGEVVGSIVKMPIVAVGTMSDLGGENYATAHVEQQALEQGQNPSQAARKELATNILTDIVPLVAPMAGKAGPAVAAFSSGTGGAVDNQDGQWNAGQFAVDALSGALAELTVDKIADGAGKHLGDALGNNIPLGRWAQKASDAIDNFFDDILPPPNGGLTPATSAGALPSGSKVDADLPAQSNVHAIQGGSSNWQDSELTDMLAHAKREYKVHHKPEMEAILNKMDALLDSQKPPQEVLEEAAQLAIDYQRAENRFATQFIDAITMRNEAIQRSVIAPTPNEWSNKKSIENDMLELKTEKLQLDLRLQNLTQRLVAKFGQAQ